jgi:hypothetical protein
MRQRSVPFDSRPPLPELKVGDGGVDGNIRRVGGARHHCSARQHHHPARGVESSSRMGEQGTISRGLT